MCNIINNLFEEYKWKFNLDVIHFNVLDPKLALRFNGMSFPGHAILKTKKWYTLLHRLGLSIMGGLVVFRKGF